MTAQLKLIRLIGPRWHHRWMTSQVALYQYQVGLFISYSAYQNNDISAFESIVAKNRASIMQDPFIREHIEDLLRNVRTQVLCKLIKPYTKIRIPFISQVQNLYYKLPMMNNTDIVTSHCENASFLIHRINSISHCLFVRLLL